MNALVIPSGMLNETFSHVAMWQRAQRKRFIEVEGEFRFVTASLAKLLQLEGGH